MLNVDAQRYLRAVIEFILFIFPFFLYYGFLSFFAEHNGCGNKTIKEVCIKKLQRTKLFIENTMSRFVPEQGIWELNTFFKFKNFYFKTYIVIITEK